MVGDQSALSPFEPSEMRCPDCRSARVGTCDVCPSCDSTAVERRDVLEHFDCGCVQPRSAFEADAGYVCPKCRTNLGSFGVDFARIGVVYDCATCSSRFGPNDRQPVCLACESGTKRTGENGLRHGSATALYEQVSQTPLLERGSE
ncbi:TackOD1 domain-containing metal-binding protein [Halorussus halophilus]|uniref:TackOD1 domain-containing metal-binding protein n=1 Tax=Halorussus halophilus TaxID=2650975 RepID=UPI0017884E7C|nr:hypothetical protein [Halorussus halophilus]